MFKVDEITFTDEDLPLEGNDYNCSLNITVQPLTLIDNNYGLNVCPLRTTLKLGCDPKTFIRVIQGVHGFDNT